MNPDQIISITLPLHAVNLILQALGNMPFNQVANLIIDVRNQGDAQVAAATAAAAEPQVKEATND